MRKQEFISELKRELSHAPAHIREEILADISEHFTEAISQGMTEEEVCRNLGQPGTIAAQVLEEYGETRQNGEEASGFEQVFEGIGNAISGIARQFTGTGDTGHDIDIDQSFPDISRISVKMAGSKIRLVPAADGMCRVTIRGRCRYYGFTVENEGGTLTVREEKPVIRFELFRFKSTLVTTVYVPGQFAGKIKVRSALGDISATDISGQLNLETAAGNINVENHKGKEMRISTAAGNATVNMAGQCIEDVRISTAAGNARIIAEETGRLKLDSAAGNVDAKITRLSGETKISTAAGSAEITAYEVAGDVDISTAAGIVKIFLPMDVNCRIDARKPGIGSLSNELTGNPHSPHTLRASSGVGSIKLKAI
ncbi:MAG: DUF4097 family beta strand repeat-containing protein [Defluviitaleaceae bacterium]|nr:DUF4097 family beta strand repeat-containing protein [Defluviitaleaceae bacterium]MCL2240123.1 DUF4097 family beta strand repeat-containing protein [Defluviitaleaceae bacterium]